MEPEVELGCDQPAGLASGGKCTNSQDEPFLPKLADDITTCAKAASDASSSAVFQSCLEKDGFTSGCAGCVTTYVGCIMDKCSTQSENAPTSAACKTCYTAKCTPALDTCAGFSPQLGAAQLFAAGDKCMNSQDEPLLSKLSTDIGDCVESTTDAA